VTVELLRLNAVVGLTGFFEGDALVSIGIQCSLCHSVVTDSLAEGIGRRRDGWANRDLDIGRIVALAPNLQPLADALRTDIDTVRTVLLGWGPGKFDAELILDGKGFRPDGRSAATLIPRLRLGWREPPHLDGMGIRHTLERFRGQPRDARARHVLRSAPE
jgi:hypothetical protein